MSEIFNCATYSSADFGTECQICDNFIPLWNPFDSYPRICDECRKRLKKLLYTEDGEE